MLDEGAKEKIINIWNSYNASEKKVYDTKGTELPNIDELRIKSIVILKKIISEFMNTKLTIEQFKTEIDSYNKRNNHWGFTAIKGQMFFNQLVKVGIDNEEELTNIIKDTIRCPENKSQALKKIDILDTFCQKYFNKAKDKRKVPNPGSVCYFLSYFWQVEDHEKWPIMYTSLINVFSNLGIWPENETQSDAYRIFQILNDEIIQNIAKEIKKPISYWEIEHAFWSVNGNPMKLAKKDTEDKEKKITEKTIVHIDLKDYIIPKISKLIELGSDKESTSSKKGYEFEKIVAEAFRQLDFDVEILGQGTGRNPDVIAKYREDNTAFLIDAKAYSEGYSLGLDNRAIKEYINIHCPKLIKEGYKKIAFIIVSNSFKTDLEEFINEVTWNTDIKRFILLTSEALLYLVAYKTKDKQNIQAIIDSLVAIKNPITAEKIISEYEDV